MNNYNIVLIVLTNNKLLIADLSQVSSELGEADFLITQPFLIDSNLNLDPWLSGFSSQKSFKIHSDKVLTITDPTESLVEKYKKLTT